MFFSVSVRKNKEANVSSDWNPHEFFFFFHDFPPCLFEARSSYRRQQTRRWKRYLKTQNRYRPVFSGILLQVFECRMTWKQFRCPDRLPERFEFQVPNMPCRPCWGWLLARRPKPWRSEAALRISANPKQPHSVSDQWSVKKKWGTSANKSTRWRCSHHGCINSSSQDITHDLRPERRRSFFYGLWIIFPRVSYLTLSSTLAFLRWFSKALRFWLISSSGK